MKINFEKISLILYTDIRCYAVTKIKICIKSFGLLGEKSCQWTDIDERNCKRKKNPTGFLGKYIS